MHPNGKWVWVASAAGGKGDWHTAGGRAHKKSQAGAAAASGAAITKTPKAKSTSTNSSKSDKVDWENLTVTQLNDGGLYTAVDPKRRIITIGSKQYRVDWDNKNLLHYSSGVKVKSTDPAVERFKKLLSENKSAQSSGKSGAAPKQPTQRKLTPKTTNVVKETSTVNEMINQAIDSIEKTTGGKLSNKEKYDIRTKVSMYQIEVRSDRDISQEATEGLHVMLGDWKQNEFKHEIENNSIEELQSKIAKQNKNIKDTQDRYESIHSQMKKYYGTMPPHNLNQSYTAVREQLALEKCKKLHIENEIEKRKKAAKILNDYIKGAK